MVLNTNAQSNVSLAAMVLVVVTAGILIAAFWSTGTKFALFVIALWAEYRLLVRVWHSH